MKKVKFEEFYKKVEAAVEAESYRVSVGTSLEADDVRQDIIEQLFKIIPKYDSGMGVKDTTYLISCIKKHAVNLAKASKQEVAVVEEEIADPYNAEDRILFSIAIDQIREYLQNRYGEETILVKIIDSLVMGVRKRDIARELGFSKSYITKLCRSKLAPVFAKFI